MATHFRLRVYPTFSFSSSCPFCSSSSSLFSFGPPSSPPLPPPSPSLPLPNFSLTEPLLAPSSSVHVLNLSFSLTQEKISEVKKSPVSQYFLVPHPVLFFMLHNEGSRVWLACNRQSRPWQAEKEERQGVRICTDTWVTAPGQLWLEWLPGRDRTQICLRGNQRIL